MKISVDHYEKDIIMETLQSVSYTHLTLPTKNEV